MDARTLDVLHDTRNQNRFAVADRVDLQLGTHQVFINQDRILNLVGENDLHILMNIGIVVRDNHVLSA